MRVEVANLIKKISEQVEKRHFLNAMYWTVELHRWLLAEHNDILKGRREDGSDIE